MTTQAQRDYRERARAAAADPTWRTHAACRDLGPALFYDEERATEAFEICDACPVRRQCSMTAAANYEQHGVWGGKQRRPPRRRPDLTASRQRRREAEADDLVRGVLALTQRIAQDAGIAS